jgi:putative transposase
MKQYVRYYDGSRTHLSFYRNAPIPRDVAPISAGQVVAIPHLGGLHHEYKRAA